MSGDVHACWCWSLAFVGREHPVLEPRGAAHPGRRPAHRRHRHGVGDVAVPGGRVPGARRSPAILDVGKGALGPALAGGDRATLAAFAGGLAVVGHNWSPFLRGAGGRGVAPALGALLVQAWPGAVLLLGGLVVGKASARRGSAASSPRCCSHRCSRVLEGAAGALAGAAIAVPMLVKRVAGNGRPARDDARTYLARLLYDREPRELPIAPDDTRERRRPRSAARVPRPARRPGRLGPRRLDGDDRVHGARAAPHRARRPPSAASSRCGCSRR